MPTVPTVKEVAFSDKPNLMRFLTYPWSVYKGDPDWVPAMIADDRDVLDPKGVFFEHATGAMWLAERDGQVVGRIFAARDDNSEEKDLGVVGFYESIDDVEVARALFGAAEGWLRAKGLKRARGPISPSLLLGTCGLLIEGPGRPVLMMAYNPTYYPKLWDACGWQKGKDLVAYTQKLSESKLDDGLVRIKEFEKQGLTFRKLNKKKLNDEIALFIGVHNAAYHNAGHYAHTSVTLREAQFLGAHLKDVLDPDLFYFVEKDGKAFAVCVGFPDASPVLQALDGKLGPIRIVKALLAQRKLKNMRIADFAVDPSQQRKLLGLSVAQLVLHNARNKGYENAEYSWIVEDNWPSRKGAEVVGGKVYRTYRIYEKAL